MYPFIIQGKNITLVIDNKPVTVSETHIAYDRLVAAIKAGDWDEVKAIAEPKQALVSFGMGKVQLVEDQLYWEGKVLHNAITTKILEMVQEGFSAEPLIEFMTNLMSNPSQTAIDELYLFLEKGNLPITPDGHFLAYKKVRKDYKDVHSGTIDNSVGQVVAMERQAVDPVRDRTCSYGLHFCSLDYLKAFNGDRVMILKINPRDVVSIPSDYNNTKGRCCRYEVVGEVEYLKGEVAELAGSVNVDFEPDEEFEEVEETAGVSSEQIPQEYDARGRPLSMTPNAIRKRKARAAKLALNQASKSSDVSTKREALKQRMVRIFSEQLGLEVKDLKESSNFITDLGADSLDVVELIMALEDEFCIEIPDEEAEKIQTVGQAIDALLKQNYS